MHCEFRGLAIECVKKSQVALSLAERQANRVDPLKQGFAHGADELDLMSVRLCFQVEYDRYKNRLIISADSRADISAD